VRSLVTGGAGFIGSHLVDRLVAAGDQVVVLDDLSTGSKENLEELLTQSKLKFVEGSILDMNTVIDAMRGVNRVFHLAAAVGVTNIVQEPLRGILTNTRGTENVLEQCAKQNCKFLLASTSEIYGKTSKIPMSEDDDRVLGSTWVHRWSYSTAKALDEHLTLAYAATGLPAVIVRYFNTYGPRLDERGYGSVIANFLRQAYAGQPLTLFGDGTQTRTFTYVDDTVSGTIAAMETAAAEGGIFNIGNPTTELSIEALAGQILEVTGSSSGITHTPYTDVFGPDFEDTPRRLPSIDRANHILNWRPAIDLRSGLSITANWWLQNRKQT